MFEKVFNLTALNGNNGFTIPGLAANNYLGYHVSAAGDVNGDGKDDLIVGAYGVNSKAGAVYVIFGQTNGFPAFFNVTTLNGSNGFTIPGLASNDCLGASVGAAGDVNGDGKADLLVG